MPTEDWSDPNVLSKAVTRKPGKALKRSVENYNRVTKPRLPQGAVKSNAAAKFVSICGASALLCLVLFGNRFLGQVCGVLGCPVEELDRVMYFLITFGLVSALLPSSLEL